MSQWTAIVVDSTQVGNLVETRVQFSDGVAQKFQQCFTHDGTLASVRAQVLATIAAKDAQAKVPTLAKGTAIDTTPDPIPQPPAPTPADVALNAFIAKFATHLKYQAGVSLGIYGANDAAVVQARADAIAAYDAKTPTHFDALLR